MSEESFISGLQNQYLRLPMKDFENVRRFTMTGQSENNKQNRDNIPFDRYVDIWWLAMCIGILEGKRKKLDKNQWHQFIRAGEVLPSNPWRVFQLKLLAVGITEDTDILFKPGQLISMANEYAATGFPVIIEEMIGQSIPIWAISDFLLTRIKGN